MGRDVELALKLQSLDQKIIALKREIAALPRHIAEIEKQLETHRRRLEADRAALAANEKERRRLEGQIQIQEQKISRLKDQMLEARTNEQYRAFQHEIEYAENEIRKAEDRILELMEEAEPLTEAVKKAEAALAEEQKEVDREKEEARRRTAADQQELEKAVEERKQVAAALNPKVFASYERIRKRLGYPVLAEGTTGRCSACNIALRPQYFQDLKHATEPMVCESCGRLLYYHEVIDVEAEKSPAP